MPNYAEAVLVADVVSGEVASISSFDKPSIRGLKQWMMRNYRFRTIGKPEFSVIGGSSEAAKKYFRDYITYKFDRNDFDGGILGHSGMVYVGIHDKNLRRYVGDIDNVLPLHIAQGIACEMTCAQSAYAEYDDTSFHYSEIRALYRQAKDTYGLSMAEVNNFVWGEFQHTITNYKFLNKSPIKFDAALENLMSEDDSDLDDDFDLDFDDDEEINQPELQEGMLKELKKMEIAASNLLELWQRASIELNDEFSEDYPFDKSFDDMAEAITNWSVTQSLKIKEVK